MKHRLSVFYFDADIHTGNSIVTITYIHMYVCSGIKREWYVCTYHSRFIPEGVAEVSQIFLRETHVLPKLASYEEHCRRTGGKSIAV
jgi:hypothetical protein